MVSTRLRSSGVVDSFDCGCANVSVRRSLLAIVFDLDGVLVDSEPLQLEAWEAYVARFGRRLPAELLPRLFGRRLIDAAHVLVREMALPVSPEQAAQERDELFLTLVPGRIRSRVGALELVAAFREVGLPVALATSGHRRYVDLVLRELGLMGAFAVQVTGDDVVCGKPAPDCYRLAVARLRVPAERAVAIEDAPLGVLSARAAGLRCLAVPNEHTRDVAGLEEADAVLPDLEQVWPWLEAAGWLPPVPE